MTDAQKLLAEYALNGSETAFREVVERYVNFVYSTALRLVGGDTQLAEDITQMVFISLAQKCRTFSSGVLLGGWLHQRTFHVAAAALRRERRRQSREREAVEMNTLHDDSNSNWREVAPVLDEAITQLGREDRTAILLRFFEQRDFRAVGAALGSHEDAARMRVNRALEKLHALLKHRGVSLSAAALGSALTAQAVTVAPAGLAMSAATAALGSAAAGTGVTLTLFNVMATTKLKIAAATIVVAGVTTTLVIQHQSQASLRELNDSLRRQIAQMSVDNAELSQQVMQARALRTPRLPAPPLQPMAPVASPEILQSTNLSALLTNLSKLATAQLESYLKENRRSAASLLAAFRTTGDAALLEEAMRNFPDDPQVAFEAALRKDASPEEGRRWLDALKQSASDNALPYYLSARDYFKAGQTDLAVQDLIAATGRQQFQDYSLDRIQADEEAYRAAGYSVAQAKMAATSNLLLPQLVEMKGLAHNLVDLANSYHAAGDENSRQAALDMAVALGQRYSDSAPGEMLISQLVGIAVERMALGAMAPAAAYGADGQTVQNRLDHLAQERSTIRELSRQFETLMPTISEHDWISYHSRTTLFGERAAVRWLVSKYGK